MNETAAAPPSLHDIVLPEPVSWMPQTVGWWVLLAVLLLALVWVSWTAVRRRRANRYRRLALARLEEIEQELADPASRAGALGELPVLVKQTALACAPRSKVAQLSGERWLRFLEESFAAGGFVDGHGRLLPTLAYATPSTIDALGDDDLRALLGLVRQWIRRHRVRV
jgi:hypothetical protein